MKTRRSMHRKNFLLRGRPCLRTSSVCRSELQHRQTIEQRGQHAVSSSDEQADEYGNPTSKQQDQAAPTVRKQSLLRGCYKIKKMVNGHDEQFEIDLYFTNDSATEETSSIFSDIGISQSGPAFTMLSSMFQRVAIDVESSKTSGPVQDIALRPLMDACWVLEGEMRRCKNYLVANDFSRNLLKVQRVIEESPSSLKTISGLLAYELSTGCHYIADPQRIKLQDPSAAMGLLWIRRNLLYQHTMYLKTFVHALDPQDAAMEAYDQELDRHLGNSWTLRKSFQLRCLVTVPRCSRIFLAILNGFNPHEFTKEQEFLSMQAVEAFLATLLTVLDRLEQIGTELGLEE